MKMRAGETTDGRNGGWTERWRGRGAEEGKLRTRNLARRAAALTLFLWALAPAAPTAAGEANHTITLPPGAFQSLDLDTPEGCRWKYENTEEIDFAGLLLERESIKVHADREGEGQLVIRLFCDGVPQEETKTILIRVEVFNWTLGLGHPIDVQIGSPPPDSEWEVEVEDPETVSVKLNDDEDALMLRPLKPGITSVIAAFEHEDFSHTETFDVNVADISQRGPTTTAGRPGSASAGDPVDMVTGEIWDLKAPDIVLAGPAPLFFQRYYASRLRTEAIPKSRLGPNWLHNFDLYLVRQDDRIDVAFYRGRRIPFERAGEEWRLVSGAIPFQLIEDEDGFRMADPRDGRIYKFDTENRLAWIDDRNGNRHTLVYDGDGFLVEVNDDFGRALHFSYAEAGARLLESVGDGERTVTFDYTFNGVLSSVAGLEGRERIYFYGDPWLEPFAAELESVRWSGGATSDRGHEQEFDESGRVIVQSEPGGFSPPTWNFEYEVDGNELVATETDPFDNTVVYRHDIEGRLVGLVDEAGVEATWGYNETGRRDRWTDRDGGVHSATFHASSGGFLTYTTPDGATTAFEYTEREVDGFSFFDVSAVHHPDGTSESFVYDGRGNLVEWTGRAGFVREYTYNERGQILTATAASGAFTTFAYDDETGLLAGVSDHEENVTTFEYDGRGRPVSIERPDGTTRSFTWNEADDLLSATDENGATAAFEYNHRGDLVEIADRAGHRVRFEYGARLGRLSRIRFEHPPDFQDRDFQSSIRILYDPAGRPATVQRIWRTSILAETAYQYDSRGFLSEVEDPTGRVWSFEYTNEGVLASVEDPAGDILEVTSNPMGRPAEISRNGAVRAELDYDPMGRLAVARNAFGSATRLSRDARGLLTATRLSGGIEADYVRDALGSIAGIVDPDGGEWLYERDPLGRIVSMSDPLGRVSEVSYDARHRPSQVVFPGGSGSATLSYDGAGNLLEQSYSDGTTFQYTYDAARRLLSAPGVSFDYSARGHITGVNELEIERETVSPHRISRMIFEEDQRVTYFYDDADRLTRVRDWVDGFRDRVSFNYDAAGRVARKERDNGTVVEYEYDADGRIVTIDELGLYRIDLTRDDRGQIVAASRVGLPRPDPAPENTHFETDAAYQVAGYTYDSQGRRTGGDGRSYTWDLASRLTGYSAGGDSVAFDYDAFGLRTERTENGATRRIEWNHAFGLPSAATVRENGEVLRRYVHTPGGSLLYSIDADENIRYYHCDEMGNVVMVTGDDGEVLATYAYTPHGRVAGADNGAGEIDNPFTYHGRWGVVEEAENLYYMRARYYDAHSGAFLSQDPVRSTHPLRINPYQFARGNPLRFVDPTGMFEVDSADIEPDARDPEGAVETAVDNSSWWTRDVILAVVPGLYTGESRMVVLPIQDSPRPPAPDPDVTSVVGALSPVVVTVAGGPGVVGRGRERELREAARARDREPESVEIDPASAWWAARVAERSLQAADMVPDMEPSAWREGGPPVTTRLGRFRMNWSAMNWLDWVAEPTSGLRISDIDLALPAASLWDIPLLGAAHDAGGRAKAPGSDEPHGAGNVRRLLDGPFDDLSRPVEFPIGSQN